MALEIDFAELGLDLDDEKATALKEALSAKHQEAIDKEVGGLKTKRDELLANERKLKDSLKQYEGIDPERARKLEDQIAQSEEARLIADGKMDEVINQRTERMRTEYDRKLQEATQTAEQAKTFAEKFRGRVLSDEIRGAASKLGLIDSAAQDAFLRAQSLFEVDDEGNVVARESAGYDTTGKPLTPETWLESMRDQAPHWFPQPKGSGSPGNNGSSASPRAWKEATTTKEKVEILKRKQAR